MISGRDDGMGNGTTRGYPEGGGAWDRKDGLWEPYPRRGTNRNGWSNLWTPRWVGGGRGEYKSHGVDTRIREEKPRVVIAAFAKTRASQSSSPRFHRGNLSLGPLSKGTTSLTCFTLSDPGGSSQPGVVGR